MMINYEAAQIMKLLAVWDARCRKQRCEYEEMKSIFLCLHVIQSSIPPWYSMTYINLLANLQRIKLIFYLIFWRNAYFMHVTKIIVFMIFLLLAVLKRCFSFRSRFICLERINGWHGIRNGLYFIYQNLTCG